jgi:hypothetical protein
MNYTNYTDYINLITSEKTEPRPSRFPALNMEVVIIRSEDSEPLRSITQAPVSKLTVEYLEHLASKYPYLYSTIEDKHGRNVLQLICFCVGKIELYKFLATKIDVNYRDWNNENIMSYVIRLNKQEFAACNVVNFLNWIVSDFGFDHGLIHTEVCTEVCTKNIMNALAEYYIEPDILDMDETINDIYGLFINFLFNSVKADVKFLQKIAQDWDKSKAERANILIGLVEFVNLPSVEFTNLPSVEFTNLP